MRQATHALSFAAGYLPPHPPVVQMYVVGCVCGWQSPPVTSEDGAKELYDQHAAGDTFTR